THKTSVLISMRPMRPPPLRAPKRWCRENNRSSDGVPNFDPRLLLTSSDYGLAYCFMTPVFLFLLILALPNVDEFAFRVTAFNALLYGLFNLSHWLVPERVWLGVIHVPLLVMPIVALGLSTFRIKCL
ncbi:MAG: hypothetical protein N2559_17665, partial [Anaerolineae bacterium]|nr:hypothetical protein [Anaerolineae bacterium]